MKAALTTKKQLLFGDKMIDAVPSERGCKAATGDTVGGAVNGTMTDAQVRAVADAEDKNDAAATADLLAKLSSGNLPDYLGIKNNTGFLGSEPPPPSEHYLVWTSTLEHDDWEKHFGLKSDLDFFGDMSPLSFSTDADAKAKTNTVGADAMTGADAAGWSCESCTFYNLSPTAQKCEMCMTPKVGCQDKPYGCLKNMLEHTQVNTLKFKDMPIFDDHDYLHPSFSFHLLLTFYLLYQMPDIMQRLEAYKQAIDFGGMELAKADRTLRQAFAMHRKKEEDGEHVRQQQTVNCK